ncbi:uncharacterized protein LOC111716644 isoform X2 [Eurytemora carolleeae]|uniref:uncharacterized protein LOC111716644 isoform X2 n=1 Tax=Eurytemora carolleeae TaxID=1294199 RepID=UPI000C77F6C9|nr:uncharacterized protein LOC111716644 isoform X2 [Eurytemora carolleeae]|eukprot:XP_023347890.1 uncharacterized protein LOC111716644 isoform X2 [Eurytemora affinis]
MFPSCSLIFSEIHPQLLIDSPSSKPSLLLSFTSIHIMDLDLTIQDIVSWMLKLAFLGLAIINTIPNSLILYNLVRRTSLWTGFNVGAGVLNFLNLTLLNIKFIIYPLILINGISWFSQDLNTVFLSGTSISVYCQVYIVGNFFHIFELFIKFFGVYARWFIIRYPEKLVVEGLGILNFLILLLPFLYSCIVTGSWIGENKANPLLQYQLCCMADPASIAKSYPTKNRLFHPVFSLLLIFFLVHNQIRANRFISGLFPRGRFSAVGGTYRRSILDRNQLIQSCLFELLLILLHELVFLLMYMYNMYSGVVSLAVHMLMDLYIVWQAWQSYNICLTEYPVLFSEKNIDIFPSKIAQFYGSVLISIVHKLIKLIARVNPQQIPSSQDLELNNV